LTDQKGIGELLIAKGALIDPIDLWGRTPFMLVARQNGNVEFGKLLLSKALISMSKIKIILPR